MSRSWASIVRGFDAPLFPAPVPVSIPAPVVFHAFCADCGKEADVCKSCNALPCYRAVYEDGLCGRCYSWSRSSDEMCQGIIYASQSADSIPFKCGPCRAERPWSYYDNLEIVRYWYLPGEKVGLPRYREIGAKPTDIVQRADEALAAFNEELAFSHNMKEALRVYQSFYKNVKKQSPLQKGSVSLEQILAGKRVSGTQFFEALADAADDGEPIHPCDVKKLTLKQLNRALNEVDEDRKYHSRDRHRYSTAEYEEMHDNMDAWASAVYEELLRR